MSDRWEYKIAQPDSPSTGFVMSGKKLRAGSEAFLNKLGNEGWECYAIKTHTYPTVFYLKRRR